MEAVILSIDAEKERISLGIKQLDGDPFNDYVSAHAKGTIVNGTVKAVEARAATVELAEGVEAFIKVSELSVERIESAADVLKEGDPIEAKIINVDRKNRSISLSIKAKDVAEEKTAMQNLNKQQTSVDGPTTIGDLIKQQMENR